ncbi:MAG: hypothetical protein SchgKO_02730 [Schleiferiaceae bacterium]
MAPSESNIGERAGWNRTKCMATIKISIPLTRKIGVDIVDLDFANETDISF